MYSFAPSHITIMTMAQFFIALKLRISYNTYEDIIICCRGHMGKEIMTEEELTQKEDELKKLEDSLTTKQTELEAKEADVNKITDNMKQGFESQIAKLTADYEERLKTRDDVIAQLSASDNKEQPHVSIIDRLNARRVAQNKKW